jgi:SAM-dependent methyltransferase
MGKQTFIREKTISDFGEQWQIHGKIDEDYWSSKELLKDYVGDLFDFVQIKKKKIAEVGSGCGRIIHMLSKFNPSELHAIEPSEGMDVLKRNCLHIKNLITHNKKGDEFEIENLDYVFSLGVIHHILNPHSVLVNIRKSLGENGKFIIWVYGRENNFFYLAFYKAICGLTKALPNFIVDKISYLLNVLLVPYIFFCKFFKLPLRDYFLKVFAPCGWEKRKYIIFDQLNPEYAKYYRKHELITELEEAGFKNIKLYHRHNYSWTAICEK